MYILTIVMLFQPVTLTSAFSTLESCESAAKSALAFTAGPQAVRSAVCEPARK